MISPDQALERLRAGNRRFVSGRSSVDYSAHETRRRSLLDGQAPFAIILGCADSRMPVEMVFDQDIGDLFVIRVAGNVVSSTQIGSVEFAATQFGTRLVVVLGHSQCGAVDATLRHLEQPVEAASPNVDGILGHIRAAVGPLPRGEGEDRASWLARAVRANIRASAQRLRRESSVLQALGRDEGLLVVEAEYSLESGAVRFFEGLA